MKKTAKTSEISTKSKFIKDMFAMIFANGVSFLISALITFIVPKILNIENYSYVQLYIFYTSYISYLHYGWVDGIRLRYGGAYYDKLDKPLFSSQIRYYSIIQFIVSFLVLMLVFANNFDGNRLVALVCICVCMFIRLPRLMPQYILEMSNRMQECARITIIERTSYLICTILVIATKNASVVSLLVCDIIGQLLSALYAFYCCRDMIRIKPVKFKPAMIEAKSNIISGIKLTIANISSLLVIGIVRQFIEYEWDISTFGKISLTISISNLLMVFIRAIAMVMFPTLRRIKADKLPSLYSKIRIGIMVPLLFMLILYYPLRIIMINWLPQYADSLKYMAILFPMCIFESKMSMLVETYLKTLRLEKWLLVVNIITVVLSLILTIITTIVLHNLNFTIVLIVLLLAFKSITSELVLSKHINIEVGKNIVLEVLLVAIFILTSWFIGGITSLIIYVVAYLIYIFISKEDIKQVYQYLRKGRDL